MARHARSLAALVLRGRAAALLVLACAMMAALGAIATGAGTGLDQQFQIWRDRVLEHPASGQVALVEIDARSLEAHAHWPWPRSLHAQALSALAKAGVREVAFDIDFSAQSNPAEDQQLIDAVRRAPFPVIVPTFRQASSQGSTSSVENLPIAGLREAAMLGSVNVLTDADGFVRSSLYGVSTAGMPRPTIAAMLAERNGDIGASFPIDTAIDPASIPRVSISDLIAGRVDPGRLRGRKVLVGATAVEMGDRYAMPGKGVLPGAIIQLMAAESLIQGTVPVDRGAWPALVLLALPLVMRRRLPPAYGFAGVVVLLPFLALALQTVGFWVIAVVPAMIGAATGGALCTAQMVKGAIVRGRTVDPDTGLPNARALSNQKLVPGGPGIAVISIANFGDAVTVLGAQRSSELVRRVAERLRPFLPALYRVETGALGWVAATDATLALGGLDQIEAVAALFNQPVEIDGRAIRIVPSFGFAGEWADAAQALDQALQAASSAAARGARWEQYSPERINESDSRLALASELDAALADGQIWLAFQPKLDIAKRQITSAEALVRWTHPQRGLLDPEQMIAAIEQGGRMPEFTAFVLESALRHRTEWLAQGIDIGLAVNLSASLPGDSGFVARVEELLAAYPDAARRLTLEVTESEAMARSEQAIKALERFAALGIVVSIDDYGTGQSTMSYLKRLPAREIKIDKSFVIGLTQSASDALMVRSTIELAHGLGCTVVAEGVETVEVLELLAAAGCDHAQGWAVGRPMTGDSLLALVRAPRRVAN